MIVNTLSQDSTPREPFWSNRACIELAGWHEFSHFNSICSSIDTISYEYSCISHLLSLLLFFLLIHFDRHEMHDSKRHNSRQYAQSTFITRPRPIKRLYWFFFAWFGWIFLDFMCPWPWHISSRPAISQCLSYWIENVLNGLLHNTVSVALRVFFL